MGMSGCVLVCLCAHRGVCLNFKFAFILVCVLKSTKGKEREGDREGEGESEEGPRLWNSAF